MGDLATGLESTLSSARLLRRPRLIGRLDGILEHRLTLICAPPGTGKTAAVSDWLASRCGSVDAAWHGADQRSNDGSAVLEDLTAQLRRFDRTSPFAGTDSVGEDLDGSPVIAVVDDAHEITAPAVWSDIGRRILGSPPWLHWVISTRADPPIAVQRLQLRGQVGQLRAVDLAFDQDETAALLTWFGLELPTDGIERLLAWSEGWAAALCVAARGLVGQDSSTKPWERLRGSESLVLDFLVEEVLDRLDRRDREFLLRISAADSVCPELAALLSRRPGALAQLRRFERDGTFLIETDASGTWYRFHGLMLALLRARLYDEMPDEAHRLMTDAAVWFRASGNADAAERHAVRAENWPLVADLCAERTVNRLISEGSLPGGRQQGADPGRVAPLLGAADAMRRRDRRAAAALLDAVGQEEATDAASSAPVRVLRDLLTIEHRRWLEPDSPESSMTRQSAVPECEHRGLAAYLTVRDGEALLAAGDDASARRCFDDVIRTPAAGAWARELAAAILTVMDVASGNTWSVSPLSIGGANQREAAMWRHTAVATTHMMRGDSTGFRRRLDDIEAAPEPPRSWLWERCHHTLRSVARWHRTNVTPYVDRPPNGLLSELLLGLGVVEGIDPAGRSFLVGGPVEEAIAVARHALAAGSVRRAEGVLSPWIDSVPAAHPRSIVELHVLMALVELRQQRERQGVDQVGRAIAHAAPRTLWGPLLAHRQELCSTLRRYGPELGATTIGAVELLDQFRDRGDEPSEELTERERVVLHYLPTLMSNAEIAAEMLISVNTVKSHLKSIYRKLGVERRRDAMLRARQVQLL